MYTTAYRKASDEQIDLLKKYYGKDDSTAVDMVKGLYEDLDMKSEWLGHVRKTVEEIQDLIDELPERSPKLALNVGLQKFRHIYLNNPSGSGDSQLSTTDFHSN